MSKKDLWSNMKNQTIQSHEQNQVHSNLVLQERIYDAFERET